jgi:hypothetical protein
LNDQRVTEILNDTNYNIPHGNDIVLQDWNDFPIEYNPDFVDEFQRVVTDDEISNEDEYFTLDVFNDTYLNMEVALPRGGGDPDDTHFACVTKHLQDKDGHPISTVNNNSLLDMREYEVEFLDGHKESLSAYLIAQHLYYQVLHERGHRHVLLDDIINFRRNDTAIDKADAFVTMRNGVKQRQFTTQGWQILCQWKDGSTNWVALKDVKHSYPVYWSRNQIHIISYILPGE